MPKMVSLTVIVQYSTGENKNLELTVPDEFKVWQLTELLERGLKVDISREIATEEKVLVGNIRLQPVKEGETYILAAMVSPISLEES